MDKPKILVIQDYFLPAFKGGGSLRTVANIVDRLADEFDFDVLCRDRDQGDTVAFEGLTPGWTRRENCRVRYLAPAEIRPAGLGKAIAETDYALLYLNSFFSKLTVFLLTLRRLGRLPDRPVLCAPRGELAPDVLAMKSFKKSVYLKLARWCGLYRDITWHASTEAEREEIRHFFDAPVEIAADLPATAPDRSQWPGPRAKSRGELRIVFLSRLVRSKNLPRAIELVGQLEGDVVFDIYGIAEDEEHLAECEALIAQLPSNVACRYRGPVPHEEVYRTLAGYHVFLFPSLTENFGHVLLEALLAGLPLVISNRTYWRGLEAGGAGYDLELDDDSGFHRALTRFVEMDREEYEKMSQTASQLALDYLADPAPVEDTRQLFRDCIEAAR